MKKTKVLFFCKHNSCRSQMAEALLRSLAPDRYEVLSAGLFPEPIHPLVYEVMNEIGLDIKNQFPKGIDIYLGRSIIDHVIIVCQESETECPRLYPMALEVDRWPLPDPAAVEGPQLEVLEAFRHTRDQLKLKIERWLTIHPS